MTTPAPDRGVRLVPVLLVLTLVSGLIDAVSFLGLGHLFTANMTGNVLVIGFAAAGAPGFSVRHSAASLVFFLAGAVAGGRVVHGSANGSRRTWARLTLATEAVLLAIAAAIAFTTTAADGRFRIYAIIACTAFALGMRTATVRKLKVADLPTTVLTMTLTALASDSRAAGGSEVRGFRRAAAVASLFLGALLGAWLVIHHGLGWPLLLAAAISGALALLAGGRD
ncbi:YoaK family protein [Streptomyces sp. NPDC000618]|uniref:YoaK family protein n=1 Tax=Streptomyces sp. NPDC000618 TaxID=3154265 RepID=UPI00332E626D